ncbi:hypothetical protein [Nocardia farcinica]|uniref:hypothetical protein n=1 Tax=Nocardia farcinica TaxID=37329 RepID=UPI001C615A46|nr:hypothetical protein [Nocardia farcinica]
MYAVNALAGVVLLTLGGDASDDGSGAKRMGATMETVVVWALACLLYWWGLL